MSNLKYFSMFSGIGGFELGIQRAFDNEHACISEESEQEKRAQGGQWPSDKQPVLLHDRDGSTPLCVGYSEIDKYAIATYEKNFGKEIKNYGDATTINTAELPDFDLLVGGFPCQAFSVAGKRAGFNDTRGTLIFDVVRILRDKRPRYFVLENVKGLLSHDSGKTFSHILEILTDSGYDVSWSVHNSKNYGVPQNRERIYLIGSLRGERRPEVFPVTYAREQNPEHIQRYEANTLTARYEGAQATGTYVGESGLNAQETYIAPNGKLIELEDRDKPYQLLETRTEQGKITRREIRQKEGRDSTLRGKDDKKYIPKNDDTANALTTGQAVIEKWTIEPGMRIRRLTPTECERLQGFPDDWTKYGVGEEPISDTQRYKMCGNAVTVNVVEAVILKLKG